MKVIIALFLSCGLISFLGGCATPIPQGSLYTQVKLPVAATANSGASSKVGTATAYSYLGMLAIGDSSIEAAKASGGITNVNHVDYDVENILGLYGKYTVTVHGN